MLVLQKFNTDISLKDIEYPISLIKVLTISMPGYYINENDVLIIDCLGLDVELHHYCVDCEPVDILQNIKLFQSALILSIMMCLTNYLSTVISLDSKLIFRVRKIRHKKPV
jgi:hypothetical protein